MANIRSGRKATWPCRKGSHEPLDRLTTIHPEPEGIWRSSMILKDSYTNNSTGPVRFGRLIVDLEPEFDYNQFWLPKKTLKIRVLNQIRRRWNGIDLFMAAHMPYKIHFRKQSADGKCMKRIKPCNMHESKRFCIPFQNNTKISSNKGPFLSLSLLVWKYGLIAYFLWNIRKSLCFHDDMINACENEMAFWIGIGIISVAIYRIAL